MTAPWHRPQSAATLPAGVLRGPHTVVFGVGQRRAVPELVRANGGGALVITDPRLAETPYLGELVDGLRSAGVAVRVFDEAAPELPREQVPRALDLARRGGTEVVVGFGGGSCLDLAKVVALLLTHGGSVLDYYGENQVPGPTAPVVAIPTTAGTGSEVTPVAVLRTHTPRGAGVGTLLPYVMAFNSPVRTAELAELAAALGVVGTDGSADEHRAGDTQGGRARAAVAAVADLLTSVGIPADLAALGVPADRLSWAAAEAMTARRLVENNPRPLDEAAALGLLRAAHAGDRAAAAAPLETVNSDRSSS